MAATRAVVEVQHPSEPERIRVTVLVTAGHPGWFDPYDGGCPPDAGEVEIVGAVWVASGEPVTLTDQDVDALVGSPDFCNAAESAALDSMELSDEQAREMDSEAPDHARQEGE